MNEHEHSPEWFEPPNDGKNPHYIYDDEGTEEPHDFQEEYEEHLEREDKRRQK
jgi:hypothetical protein